MCLLSSAAVSGWENEGCFLHRLLREVGDGCRSFNPCRLGHTALFSSFCVRNSPEICCWMTSVSCMEGKKPNHSAPLPAYVHSALMINNHLKNFHWSFSSLFDYDDFGRFWFTSNESEFSSDQIYFWSVQTRHINTQIRCFCHYNLKHKVRWSYKTSR